MSLLLEPGFIIIALFILVIFGALVIKSFKNKCNFFSTKEWFKRYRYW